MEVVEEALVPVIEDVAAAAAGLHHVDAAIVVDGAGHTRGLGRILHHTDKGRICYYKK